MYWGVGRLQLHTLPNWMEVGVGVTWMWNRKWNGESTRSLAREESEKFVMESGRRQWSRVSGSLKGLGKEMLRHSFPHSQVGRMTKIGASSLFLFSDKGEKMRKENGKEAQVLVEFNCWAGIWYPTKFPHVHTSSLCEPVDKRNGRLPGDKSLFTCF